MQTDREADRQTDRQRYMQTDRQTDRQLDRQTEIQYMLTDRQTDRQTWQYTQTHTYTKRIRETKVTGLRYWQGNGLGINRSLVRVLAGHHCIVVLDKLLTPVCLCHQAA